MKFRSIVVRLGLSVFGSICLLGLVTLAHAHSNPIGGVWSGHLSVVGLDRLNADALLSVSPGNATLSLTEGSMHCTLTNGAYQETEQAPGYSIVFAQVGGDVSCRKFVNETFEFTPGPNRRVWAYSVSYAGKHGEEIRASGTLMRPL
jgi:hypothetical protein